MPDNNMHVRICMLKEENLYRQQDFKKGNSTLIGFESLCFSCSIAPHFYRVRVTRVQDVMGSPSLLHLLLVHCHYTHTLAYVNRVQRKRSTQANQCLVF